MSYSDVWHDSLYATTHSIRAMVKLIQEVSHVTWLIRICGMTHLCMWHDSYGDVTCLIQICDMTLCTSSAHSSRAMVDLIREVSHVSWLIYICDMSYLFVWHDPLRDVTWLSLRNNALHSRHGWLDSRGPVCDINTLQHTATHCTTLQRTAPWFARSLCNTLQKRGLSATLCNCNALQLDLRGLLCDMNTLQCAATHCNALQHTAMHCNCSALQLDS